LKKRFAAVGGITAQLGLEIKMRQWNSLAHFYFAQTKHD
jgi:hypothetical protein